MSTEANTESSTSFSAIIRLSSTLPSEGKEGKVLGINNLLRNASLCSECGADEDFTHRAPCPAAAAPFVPLSLSEQSIDTNYLSHQGGHFFFIVNIYSPIEI